MIAIGLYAAVALAFIVLDRWATRGMVREYRDWLTTLAMGATWPIVLVLLVVGLGDGERS